MNDFGKPWPFGLSRRNALYFGLGFAVLIALLYLLDRPVSVLGTGLPADVRRVFRWITRWGESDWVLIPTFAGWLIAWLLSIVTRDKLKAALGEFAALSGFIFAGVGFPGLISAILKRVFGRGRPETWTAEAPIAFRPFSWGNYDWQSFPSGHATTSFALAAVIALLWPRAFWVAIVLAATIAISRIILGQHYPTDITAGAVLGVLGAYAVRAFFVQRGWLFSTRDGLTLRQPFTHIPALFRN
jgi:membrane-associated phospholipid phosphatase